MNTFNSKRGEMSNTQLGATESHLEWTGARYFGEYFGDGVADKPRPYVGWMKTGKGGHWHPVFEDESAEEVARQIQPLAWQHRYCDLAVLPHGIKPGGYRREITQTRKHGRTLAWVKEEPLPLVAYDPEQRRRDLERRMRITREIMAESAGEAS